MVKEYDKDDPFEMKAMEIPGGNIIQQAQVMAEEYRDMGMPQDELIKIFADPFYGGLHMVYTQLGVDAVESIVDQAYGNIRVINGQES
ncbi:MAG: hypothetical protein QF622_03230 [Candidatus Marinimicrobia bacterium]|jgi:hypothetical protein|nr:hypothetical protein [Candidatus Neomarinimicrobiota bacterium]|tara:strand:+ start:879 stop:1142 length:264 start_codon:yes stop_codon:yes gene_type:complete